VSVLSTQALAEPWRRLGGRHQPADLAAGDGGEVAPDVVVAQPENADPKPGGYAPARARYAGQVWSPPSTRSTWPETWRPASVTKYSTARAMSSGWP
jgi:hypothetical protein